MELNEQKGQLERRELLIGQLREQVQTLREQAARDIAERKDEVMESHSISTELDVTRMKLREAKKLASLFKGKMEKLEALTTNQEQRIKETERHCGGCRNQVGWDGSIDVMKMLNPVNAPEYSQARTAAGKHQFWGTQAPASGRGLSATQGRSLSTDRREQGT